MNQAQAHAVQAELTRANRAMELFNISLNVFNENCKRYSFMLAENERENLHSALDAYLDAFLSASLKIETGQSSGSG